MKHNLVIVACARWEADSIVEWAAYHRQIGIDHIYLYCNDDDASEMYKVLLPFIIGDKPFISFRFYPYLGIQDAMYKHWLASNGPGESNFMIFLDIDEYLHIPGYENVNDLVSKKMEFADCLYLNWVYFGHSDMLNRTSGSVILEYTRRARSVNSYTKVISRISSLDITSIIRYEEIGFWHRWNPKLSGKLRQVNTIGDDMTPYFADSGEFAARYLARPDIASYLMDDARINHYAFRSEQDLERRVARGLHGSFGGQSVFKHVIETNTVKEFLGQFNEIIDTALAAYWEPIWFPGAKLSVFRPAVGELVTDFAAVSQSSIAHTPSNSVEEDARRLIAPRHTGLFRNHTALEYNPWWQVEFTGEPQLSMIRIFNRIDNPELNHRFNRFRIEVKTSNQVGKWTTIIEPNEDIDVGGFDGDPLEISLDPVRTKACRITLLKTGCLHLDRVEFYETK